nr:immunoglobulin heavy chain junction region [Macaca mulatta]MOV89788.1 immunoglobulin heavy chain junction region [Macaca mulatta]
CARSTPEYGLVPRVIYYGLDSW